MTPIPCAWLALAALAAMVPPAVSQVPSTTPRCRATPGPVLTAEVPLGDKARASLPLDAAFGPEGGILVLDADVDGAAAIRVFTGEEERTLQPPGLPVAFSPAVAALETDASGEIHVWDPGKQQLVVLAPDGSLLRTFTVLGEPSHRMPAPFAIDRHGKHYFGLREFDDRGRAVEKVAIYGPAGETLGALGPYAAETAVQVTTKSTISSISLPLDLASRTVWAVSPRGTIALAATRGSEITLLAPGEPLARVPIDASSVPTGNEDVQAVLALGGTTGFSLRRVRRLIPAVKATIPEFFVTEDHLLVRRPGPGAHLFRLSYDLIDLRGGSWACWRFELPARVVSLRPGRMLALRYQPDGRTAVAVFAFGREGEP